MHFNCGVGCRAAEVQGIVRQIWDSWWLGMTPDGVIDPGYDGLYSVGSWGIGASVQLSDSNGIHDWGLVIRQVGLNFR